NFLQCLFLMIENPCAPDAEPFGDFAVGHPNLWDRLTLGLGLHGESPHRLKGANWVAGSLQSLVTSPCDNLCWFTRSSPTVRRRDVSHDHGDKMSRPDHVPIDPARFRRPRQRPKVDRGRRPARLYWWG